MQDNDSMPCVLCDAQGQADGKAGRRERLRFDAAAAAACGGRVEPWPPRMRGVMAVCFRLETRIELRCLGRAVEPMAKRARPIAAGPLPAWLLGDARTGICGVN